MIEPSGYLGYQTKYSYANRKIGAHQFSIVGNDKFVFDTGDSQQNRMLNSLVLKDWGKKDLLGTKNRMLSGGFATYRDIENLALLALSKDELSHFVALLVKRYPLIIIDECQDLSKEQLMILQALADYGTKLHFIGDLHQAIYGFRGVEPDRVKEFVTRNLFKELQLNRNFRSCQNIVDLCSSIVGRNNITGTVTWLNSRCLVIQYDTCPTELIETFEEICKGFENNVIVSRGHSVLRKFHTSVTKISNIQKLALAIKQFDPHNLVALNESLELLSEFIRHHLKESTKASRFNCPQSVESNLAWRKFLCKILMNFSEHGLQNMTITWSDWVKQAKVLVRGITKLDYSGEAISSALVPLNTVNLISPTGLAKQEVHLCLDAANESSLSLSKSTIHGAKGETHDVTILISTARAGGEAGSHWSSWINNPNSEGARYAYVASSRPRHYLIWAVKKLKPDEKKQLKSKGFSILS